MTRMATEANNAHVAGNGGTRPLGQVAVSAGRFAPPGATRS